MQTTDRDRKRREAVFHDESADTDLRTDTSARFYSVTRASQRRHFELLDAVLASEPESQVLDIGCGCGTQAVDIARRHPQATVVGADISPRMIVAAKARLEAEDPGVAARLRFELGDGEGLARPAASFDLVTVRSVLHHLDVRAGLAEIRRLLRPGGIAVFTEPLRGNPAIDAYRRLTPRLRSPDERPLGLSDLRLLESELELITVDHYHLTTLASFPFRQNKNFDRWLRRLERADGRILAASGPLGTIARRWAWQVVVAARARE